MSKGLDLAQEARDKQYVWPGAGPLLIALADEIERQFALRMQAEDALTLTHKLLSELAPKDG